MTDLVDLAKCNTATNSKKHELSDGSLYDFNATSG